MNGIIKAFFTKIGERTHRISLSSNPEPEPEPEHKTASASMQTSAINSKSKSLQPKTAPVANAGTGAAAAISPLVLAYVGDSVYEVYVRATLAGTVGGSVHKLHTYATKYVRCESQSEVLHSINGTLTEQERDIVRRGRNAHSGYVPKNANIAEYRYATGFESLLGHLFLSGDIDRLDYIMALAYERATARIERISNEGAAPLPAPMPVPMPAPMPTPVHESCMNEGEETKAINGK